MWCLHQKNDDLSKEDGPVYGEFIRTFTFDSVSLPIVQPGGFVVFPDPTVRPSGVEQVSSSIDGKEFEGLSVPGGVYRIRWALNPSEGAEVTLQVNGKTPTSKDKFPYGKQIKDSKEPIGADYLVLAPKKEGNLISIINSGSTLFTLSELPYTRIGNRYILTQIQVKRISPL